jgi:hypothetical protein
MVTRILGRLVLMLTAMGLATALLLGAMSMLATPPAKAAPVLLRDHAGAVEKGTSGPRNGDEPASRGPALPAAALVFAGILLLATLPPAHRVNVYYHRPPGTWWQ